MWWSPVADDVRGSDAVNRGGKSHPAGGEIYQSALPRDDISTAMSDAELTAHLLELRDLLAAIPQGDDCRGPLLVAFGRACTELNARGLPYDPGGPRRLGPLRGPPTPAASTRTT